MTEIPHFISASSAATYDAVCAATTNEQLDKISKEMWGKNANGEISDDEAQALGKCIEQRRVPQRSVGPDVKRGLPGRVGTRFKSRQHPRSPDVFRRGIRTPFSG